MLASVFKVADPPDLFIVNLECPILDLENPIKKSGPVMKVSTTSAEILKYIGVDIVSGANNHIYDHGDLGIIETLKILKRISIEHLGFGETNVEAARILFKTIKGKVFAFINYTENEFGIASTSNGGANPFDPINAFHDITSVKKMSDYIIVIYHGGNEYFALPSPRIKKQCHFMVDCGADAIICHHSHFFSGIEKYNNSLIAYGLGNFLFDLPNKPAQWYNSGILSLIINEIGISFKVIPINQCTKEDACLLNLMDSEKQNDFLQKVLELSSNIQSDQNLNQKWDEFVAKKAPGYLSNIYGLSRIQKYLYRKKIYKLKVNSYRKLALLNLIRCESHRDIVIKVMEDFTNHNKNSKS